MHQAKIINLLTKTCQPCCYYYLFFTLLLLVGTPVFWFSPPPSTLLANLSDDAIAYCLALCDKIFDRLPLDI